ncbi:MAG TPA: TetR/AcrR family transcriptional regulator [Desulfobacteraceae bacterium]|nr:TetR/AcrR family transcriptional regulator [Desulfobacteraceae bacterium]
MTKEKLPTDVRREQIVASALQVMGENPDKHLHIKDIAQRMGLAPSALYRHFRNRDAIMSAIFEFIRIKLYSNIETVRQTSEDAETRLRELLERHIRLIKSEHGIPRMIFSDELWGQNQEKRQKMFRIVTGYLAEIEDIVREGQFKGEIRQDMNPMAAARMFFGVVQPAALLWHMSEGRFDLDEHLALAWPFFWQTVMNQESICQ